MEELAKKIEQIFNQFFRDCQGNRLTPWAWATLCKTVLDTIKNHKPIKSGANKEEEKS